jgi:hypothetical protein
VDNNEVLEHRDDYLALQPGTVKQIRDQKFQKGYNPLVQVIKLDKFLGAYSIKISDGTHHTNASCPKELNDLIESGSTINNAMIPLKQFQITLCTVFKGETRLSIQSFEVVKLSGTRIGDPRYYVLDNVDSRARDISHKHSVDTNHPGTVNAKNSDKVNSVHSLQSKECLELPLPQTTGQIAIENTGTSQTLLKSITSPIMDGAPDDESNLLPLSEEATSIALTRNAISALYTQDKSKEELFQPIIQVHQVDESLCGYSYANGTDNTHYIRVLFRNYSSSIKNGHVLQIKQHELRCFVMETNTYPFQNTSNWGKWIRVLIVQSRLIMAPDGLQSKT